MLEERGRDCMRDAGFVPVDCMSSFFDRGRDRDLLVRKL